MKCETTLALFAFSHVVLAVPYPWRQAVSEHAESISLLSVRDHEHLPISARAQVAEDLIRDEETSLSRIENHPNDHKSKIPIIRRAQEQSLSSEGLFRGPSINFETPRTANRKGSDSAEKVKDDDYDDDDDDDEVEDEDEDEDNDKKDKKKPGFFRRIINMFKFRKSNKDESDQ